MNRLQTYHNERDPWRRDNGYVSVENKSISHRRKSYSKDRKHHYNHYGDYNNVYYDSSSDEGHYPSQVYHKNYKHNFSNISNIYDNKFHNYYYDRRGHINDDNYDIGRHHPNTPYVHQDFYTYQKEPRKKFVTSEYRDNYYQKKLPGHYTNIPHKQGRYHQDSDYHYNRHYSNSRRSHKSDASTDTKDRYASVNINSSRKRKGSLKHIPNIWNDNYFEKEYRPHSSITKNEKYSKEDYDLNVPYIAVHPSYQKNFRKTDADIHEQHFWSTWNQKEFEKKERWKKLKNEYRDAKYKLREEYRKDKHFHNTLKMNKKT